MLQSESVNKSRKKLGSASTPTAIPSHNNGKDKHPSLQKKVKGKGKGKQNIFIDFVYVSKFLGELPYPITPLFISTPSHKTKPKSKSKPKKGEDVENNNKKEEEEEGVKVGIEKETDIITNDDDNDNNNFPIPILETTTTTTIQTNLDSINNNNNSDDATINNNNNLEPNETHSDISNNDLEDSLPSSPRRNYWEYEYEYPDNFEEEYDAKLTELELRCIDEGDIEEEKIWGTKSDFRKIRPMKYHRQQKTKRFEKALTYRKREEKEVMIAEHFERQKENATAHFEYKPMQYTRIDRSYSYVRRDEEALNQYLEGTELIRIQCGLTEKQLEDLLTRDLSPEDYDLLLQLDTSVEKKTLKGKIDLSSFPTREINSREESSCIVCMCEYEVGESVTVLPCSHFFHSQCIYNWLTESSVTCPVDNLPVKLEN